MHAVIVFLCLCPIRAAFVQDCPSRQDMQSSLKQVQKLLSTHEAAYLQSLRTLRKKLNLLQNTATKQTGKANNDINECASSPCLNGGTCVDEMNQFSCTCTKGWAGATCQSPVPTSFVTMTNTSSATSSAATTISPPAVTVGPFFHPSHCTHVQGTTHCTCDPGYTISGRDGTSCKDIDECELFHMGQAGRLCIHACVNTPGGYRCTCPAGYNLTRDGRNCKDIDECATRLNNCTRDQMCLNNYGGFQCVRVDCPAYETPPTAKPHPCVVSVTPPALWTTRCALRPLTPSPTTTCLSYPTCQHHAPCSVCRPSASWATRCVSPCWAAGRPNATSRCSGRTARQASWCWGARCKDLLHWRQRWR
ncbi:fibrillin-3 [Oncorhynchus tshawytscha]|uniref:fibrillin-3 n=1 Tax=Oncorhynchus tshawytscha TaxID=74940 RepID=UPI001C3E1A20|nr:fibrillin-3 [Oncorhynchus tshawytscha]